MEGKSKTNTLKTAMRETCIGHYDEAHLVLSEELKASPAGLGRLCLRCEELELAVQMVSRRNELLAHTCSSEASRKPCDRLSPSTSYVLTKP